MGAFSLAGKRCARLGGARAASSHPSSHPSRLFVAEGVAKGHPVLWVSDGGAEGAEEADRWWLPSPAAARRARDPHPALGDDGGTELRIAWQYRRYLGAESGGPGLGVAAGGGDTGAGTSNPSRRGPRAAPDRGAERGWCGDYDLMRPLQAPHQGVTTLAAGVDGGGEAQSAVAWVRALAGGGGPPARLAIDATRPDAWSEGGEGLVRLLWQLRAAVQGARAAALVVVCTGAPVARRAWRFNPMLEAWERKVGRAILPPRPTRSAHPTSMQTHSPRPWPPARSPQPTGWPGPML